MSCGEATSREITWWGNGVLLYLGSSLIGGRCRVADAWGALGAAISPKAGDVDVDGGG